MDMTFKFLVGQNQASLFYTNRFEAFLELVSTGKISAKLVDGGGIKKDVPASPITTRVANMRVPAGHWIVVERDNAEEELEIKFRRIADGSGVLDSPTKIVDNEAFSASGGETIGLVKNDLVRPMTYRLTMRADNLKQNLSFHVQSGPESITPLSGSFVLDTVVPSGGTLEIKVVEGTFAGHYDLHVDP